MSRCSQVRSFKLPLLHCSQRERERERERERMNGEVLQLPPGFRFHPTDEELVTHYLCRKCAARPIAVPVVADIDLYKHDPWQLPGMAVYGEREWYFFSPRDRKYPNGSRPNRAAGSGYWKATGADKPIGSPKPVAIKKALVFYVGKAPRGEKTNWIMHEFRLADVDRSVRRKTHSLRLDDWVLCRIYHKRGEVAESTGSNRSKPVKSKAISRSPRTWTHESKPRAAFQVPQPVVMGSHVRVPDSDLLYFDPSESLPRLHTDSSGSELVLSPGNTCEIREVQSQLTPKAEWDKALDFPINNGDAIFGGFGDPFQDIFMDLDKPI